MKEYTPLEVESIVQDTLSESLEEVLRSGAVKMLCAALRYEVDEYIARFAHKVDEQGHRAVVKNGYHPARQVTTGIGKIPVRQPRVHDRREGHHFTSAILPKYARRSPSIDTLIPSLYLKGVSTSAFPQALEAILGKGAPGLSAANITRLKRIWEDEYDQWCSRPLTDKAYVYVWADGIYFNVRLSNDRPCVLVLIGATAQGQKEVLAIQDGQRESTLSWATLLQGLKARGLRKAPALAIGDGAMGFWTALEEAFPETRHQRCWVHKTCQCVG